MLNSFRALQHTFIDKDKPLRIEPRLLPLQGLTCGGDVWAILLGGPQTFF
jgi:hypothetical protein